MMVARGLPLTDAVPVTPDLSDDPFVLTSQQSETLTEIAVRIECLKLQAHKEESYISTTIAQFVSFKWSSVLGA